MGDFISSSTHKSRKIHKCNHCGQVIEIGSIYEKTAGVFQGDFIAAKSHLECEKAWYFFNWDKDGPKWGDPYDGALPLSDMDWWEDVDKELMLEKFPIVHERMWASND